MKKFFAQNALGDRNHQPERPGSVSVIQVRVLDVRPHPDQATNNPGCWAVRLEVSHASETRTFWRWHSVREIRDGAYVDPPNREPTHTEIVANFWSATFDDLHGFSFGKETP